MDLLVERLDQLALARVVVLVEEAVHALEQSGDAIGGREVQGAGGYYSFSARTAFVTFGSIEETGDSVLTHGSPSK